MGLQEAERGGGLQAMNHGGEILLPSRLFLGDRDLLSMVSDSSC